MTSQIEAILSAAPVIPVLVIDDIDSAVPLARALVAGGLTSLEVTLRTPVALDAIRAMAEAVPEAQVGVGTVLTGDDLDAAHEAGAIFAVAPGSSPALLRAASDHPLPLLPGAATASEVMQLMEQGYLHQKFFPAAAAGGPKLLKSIGGPLPQVTFCPTGGIDADSARSWLELSNVACIGGSWVAPRSLIEQEDWDQIEALARAAKQLG